MRGLDIRYVATPEAVAQARRTAREYARSHIAEEEVVEAVALVVSEACTNAVQHAYRHRGQPGEIELTARALDDRLEIVVADRGLGMSPRLDSPGLGMGLALMAQLAQGLEVRRRQGGGTEVRIRFARSGSERASAPRARTLSRRSPVCGLPAGPSAVRRG